MSSGRTPAPSVVCGRLGCQTTPVRRLSVPLLVSATKSLNTRFPDRHPLPVSLSEEPLHRRLHPILLTRNRPVCSPLLVPAFRPPPESRVSTEVQRRPGPYSHRTSPAPTSLRSGPSVLGPPQRWSTHKTFLLSVWYSPSRPRVTGEGRTPAQGNPNRRGVPVRLPRAVSGRVSGCGKWEKGLVHTHRRGAISPVHTEPSVYCSEGTE